ncbi:hypothetical protein H4R21_002037 [Coemansia helicoidea]|uniref:Uncharacterized protein n=1 Tax=Coemansia helicoidea TaxID=1286919 RepID=A0ACC1L8Q9_9FUNG|nr:hypothetical protein H4R21_002037 [Coemansia helicoidea]
MVSSHLRFQSLPRRIIATVLWHLQRTGTSRVHTRNGLFSRRSALALLHTCRRWRSEVLALMCSEFEITVPAHGGTPQGEFRRWPLGLPQPDSACFSLVRSVSIDADYGSIFTGAAVRAMHAVWKQPVFRRAADLRLTITHSHSGDDILMHDYDGHAQAFARSIRAMVPAVHSVSVRYAAYARVDEMPADRSLNALLAAVFRGSRYSALAIAYNEFAHAYQPQVAHALTRIQCCWDEGYHRVVPLLHASAGSLADLRLACHGVARRALSQLFVDAHGQYVGYTSLQRLAFEDAASWGPLYQQEDPASWERLFRPTLPNAVFVPRLRHLRLGMPYPFCDDILFRGNAATLETLWLTPTLPFLHMMEQYGVFARSAYPRLRRITLAPYSHYVSDRTDVGVCADAAGRDAELAAAAAQFVHRASPRVQAVDIREGAAGAKLVCAMVQSTQMAALRALHIPRTALTLTDIVTLLQALPRLAALHCVSGGVGDEFEGVSHAKLAAYMHHTYYPLSSAFRQWGIASDAKAPIDDPRAVADMAACTLLLSVMCPVFVRAQVPKSHANAYNSVIRRAIARNPADRFVRNMRRLLLPVE